MVAIVAFRKYQCQSWWTLIGHINKELEIFVRAVMWRNPVRNAGSWPGTPTTMGTLIILTLEQFFRRRFNINRCCPVVVIIMNNHSNILTFLDCIEGFKSQRDTSSCFMFYCTYLHKWIMNCMNITLDTKETFIND